MGEKGKNGFKYEKYHITECNFFFSVSDYVYTLLLQKLVVKCDYVLQQVQTLHALAVIPLTINMFSPVTSIYLLFISYHFIHSLLMTHFTSNYYYTLKIACVGCIFACSYSLSHPFSFTIITQCRRVKLGEHGTYETLATLP